MFFSCCRLFYTSVIFSSIFWSVGGASQVNALDWQKSSLTKNIQNIVQPLYAKIFWPNDFFINDISDQEPLTLKKEIEGIAYFVPVRLKGPHHIWGDINFTHYFGGAGYRYLIQNPKPKHDQFWGLYSFYFNHKEPLANHWNLGFECGDSHATQFTLDGHYFFYSNDQKIKSSYTYAALDKYSVSAKVSHQLSSQWSGWIGGNLAWVQDVTKTQPDRKDRVIAGLAWYLNTFVRAEVQAMCDLKCFKPVARMSVCIQADGISLDVSNHFSKPPQRTTPPRYVRYNRKPKAAMPTFQKESPQQPTSSKRDKDDVENLKPNQSNERNDSATYPKEIYSAKETVDRNSLNKNSTPHKTSSTDMFAPTYQSNNKVALIFNLEEHNRYLAAKKVAEQKGTTPPRAPSPPEAVEYSYEEVD